MHVTTPLVLLAVALQMPGAWTQGAQAALGALLALALHEVAHLVIDRRQGRSAARITLLPFGGWTETHPPVPSAAAEWSRSLAGPITSAAFSLLSRLIATRYAAADAGPEAAVWLSTSRFSLALGLVNLLPAFPLDGGRVLRRVLGPWTGPVWTDALSARTGRACAIALAVWNLWPPFYPVGVLWAVLLYHASTVLGRRAQTAATDSGPADDLTIHPGEIQVSPPPYARAEPRPPEPADAGRRAPRATPLLDQLWD